MKKFLSLLLAIAMLISLSACGAAAGKYAADIRGALPVADQDQSSHSRRL